HIVVNNSTNAGMSIPFLVVVYRIIFFGIKTWPNVRTNKVRTDTESPPVPVPAAGVKSSSPHQP
ncbi:carbon starvation protein A, partial [Klebsiella pneumoniae]